MGFNSRSNRYSDNDKTSLIATIGLAAASSGTVAGVMGYTSRQDQMAQIPLAFSEINEMRRQYEAADQDMPPLTEFHAKLNDMTMKIFEASNIAHASGEDNIPAVFARELELRMIDGRGFDHDLISEYLDELPDDAKAALSELDNMVRAGQAAGPIASSFDKAWRDYHSDNYRTEIYYVTVTTGTGENRTTRQEQRTRQVYESTDHDYNYYRQHGEAADRQLQTLVHNTPHIDANLNGRFYNSTGQIGEDNLRAMQDSRADELDGEDLDPSIAQEYAETWSGGSTLAEEHNEAVQAHRDLVETAPKWNQAKHTARSHHYRTYTRLDSGPREFRIAAQGERHAMRLHDTVARVVAGIKMVEQTSPQLSEDIFDMINIGLGETDGDAEVQMEEVLNTARDMYTQNFENGFDVTPTSWGMIVLVSLLGTIAGGGLGAGGHTLAKKILEERELEYIFGRKAERDNRYSLDTIPEPDPEFSRPKQTPLPEPEVIVKPTRTKPKLNL